MNAQANQDERDRQLWRRSAAAGGGAPPAEPIDPNDLAAWLEGTADDEARLRVEARLAADAELLDEVMELRAADAGETAAVPESLLRRARSLRPSETLRATAPTTRVLALAGAWWRRAQWAAAAAAVIVACVGGYSFGQGTFHARQKAEARAHAVVSAGLNELIADPTLDVTARSNGRNGGAS